MTPRMGLFGSLEISPTKHFSGHGVFKDLSTRMCVSHCRFETSNFECEDLLRLVKRMGNVLRPRISRVIVGIRLRIVRRPGGFARLC
jgi:hypothetical protein